MDYLKLYNLEQFLFEDVTKTFQNNGSLSAFDFFCIIIWKANRAKSKVARKLLTRCGNANKDLNSIVKDLTSAIAKAQSGEEQMRLLIEDWAFRLPMASAILTVMYPTSFTVYDVRACDQLQKHHNLQNKTQFKDLWDGYNEYLKDVKRSEPTTQELRDKDRVLWARSFEKQLNDDICTLFKKEDE